VARQDEDQTLFNILDKIGRRLLELAEPRVMSVSKMLADSLDYFVEMDVGQTYVEVPHYWALYLHDGRNPFEPRRSRKSDGKKIQFLVWFADPKDDPRLAGGYPVRADDIKQLSQEDFARCLQINTERHAAGQAPFMFMTRFWPTPTPGTFFFTQGCAPIQDEIPEIIDAEMMKMLGDLGAELSERPSKVTFKLR
jgi:hypothetical protein